MQSVTMVTKVNFFLSIIVTAYLAKMIVHTGNLPLQFYSTGRHYDPGKLYYIITFDQWRPV